ncbi:MAG TPA: hypothetical protein VGU63_00315 [Candidatus Acidoferrales bacterium]|nr:hypothetical protein [Candidatus Acidoferrales bacterium]
MRRTILVSIFSLALFGAVATRAEHTRFWDQSSFAELDKGTHKGLALRSDGTLMPAPEFKPFADPDLAFVWALAVDSRGRVYAAGGSDAKVLRLDPSGKTTVFESTELAAQALAVDKQDNVYVATSPDGKVYKITPDGKHSVFFDPKTKYIWALAFDSAGTLFVATGDKGEIYAVAPDGKGQLFFKSDESHARSLAFDRNGDLLVGTDPSGLIIRVPFHAAGSAALPQAGKAFVIYETSKKEVTAVATDASGNIYAAAVGNKTPRQTRPGATQTSAAQLAAAFEAAATRGAARPGAAIGAGGVTGAAPIVFPQFPIASGGSEVYRIASDGSPESLWSSPQDVVYALGFSPENHLLLATGNHGEVVELTDNHMFSSLAASDASQVTSLVMGPGHKVYVATANPGQVFTLGPEYATEGTFESDPFDAKIYSRWGRLTWWGEHDGEAGKIEFYVRSGNTSDPDDYWSPWSGPYSDASGDNVQCPPARFVQWKAVFHSAAHRSGSESVQRQPTLAWVKLAYLRNNVAPVIDGIVVEQPGLRAQGFSSGAGSQQPPSIVPLRVPETHEDGEPSFSGVTEVQQQHMPHFTPPPQGFSAKGYQTAVWTAHDENDDDLTFSLYYRGQGEKEWKLLKDDIHEDFYSWDTNLMPDGDYYLKLVASDHTSNPDGQSLTVERISDRFQVDNNPPTVEKLRAEQSGNEWHLRFTARDAASAIARSSYSVDARHWQSVFPEGQLTDALVENYDVALRGLKPGEHTIAVQVFDQFENSAAAKVTFTVPPAIH